jgi:putative phosphoesterase
MNDKDTTRISVLSDTHNTLPRALLTALKGSSLIIHAGDFATEAVLTQLEKIAPVAAVRGNCDTGVLATLPHTVLLERGRETILVVHDLNTIQQDTIPPAVTLVICGHTHVPVLTSHRGRRWLNPGSPVSPRGGSAPSFAEIRITAQETDIIHRTLAPPAREKNAQ